MKIGSLTLASPVVLAPMAGITNLPYRMIMKEQGAALVVTEMVSANGLIRDGVRTRELLISDPGERPLSAQLFGDDPEVLAEGARIVAPLAEVIDINMGCPVKKVIRSGAGSALLRDPARIRAIVAAVRRAADTPLTVKIRSGWDAASINYLEVGRILEGEGADAIALHPRTKAEGFGGHSNWNHIARLKEEVAIPVIGSGDIKSADDALRMLRETGCDGIMLGRGVYGNPWLIRDILDRLAGREPSPVTAAERRAVVLRHMELYRDHFGERKTLVDMRKHLCWYSRGMDEAALFRSQVNLTESLDLLFDLVDRFFSV